MACDPTQHADLGAILLHEGTNDFYFKLFGGTKYTYPPHQWMVDNNFKGEEEI